ncbi:putative protein (DUF45 domain) [Campylobacter pinnipediorum subsp. caledonicus]|uniref:M48 family metallopeptidase n=1 Tax=Campylobacter pinnipediorum TaxID=1965231 RepID=UPI0009952869|nr:SprT family zinc-dependent metalloprotease [Campylobacter pinnipediorum]AQW85910.1 putative protein (DUF45 domain) [Campylobacter pinnipediorum subsp. caledonicus]
MAIKTTCVNFCDFVVELKFKSNVKYLRLKIDNNAKITCSLPYKTTNKRAMEFLNENRQWLIDTHKKVVLKKIKDDEFYYLGEIYKIKIDQNIKEILFKDNEIFIKDKKMLENFKREKFQEISYFFIDKFMPFINRKINHVSIKNMNTRWGSCNHKKGYINLNLKLIHKKIELIEYVVLHELTHLIYPNHKMEFYKFIENIMPDFRQREKGLKNI